MAVRTDHSRSSREWRVLAARFKEECRAADAVCWLCHGLIDFDADPTVDDYSFHPDHFYPWTRFPELRLDPENLRPSHRLCNLQRGDEMPRPDLGSLSRDWFGVAV